jgi:hypothetical protein
VATGWSMQFTSPLDNLDVVQARDYSSRQSRRDSLSAVAQRTQEFGVRTGLGASSGDVLAMVMRQSLMLTSIGIGIGVLVAALFVAVTSVAACLPARRATRIRANGGSSVRVIRAAGASRLTPDGRRGRRGAEDKFRQTD